MRRLFHPIQRWCLSLSFGGAERVCREERRGFDVDDLRAEVARRVDRVEEAMVGR